MDLLTNLYPSSQQGMMFCENHVVAVQNTTLNFIKINKKTFQNAKVHLHFQVRLNNHLILLETSCCLAFDFLDLLAAAMKFFYIKSEKINQISRKLLRTSSKMSNNSHICADNVGDNTGRLGV